MGTGQKFFNDFSELVWISIYAKSLKSLANLAETVQTDPGSRPLGRRTWPGDSLDLPPRGRTGCVLSVLASKIQTWSHLASASRARRDCPETSSYVVDVAIYHLESPDVARSTAWRAAVDTPWTARVVPHFRDRIRILTHRYVRGG